MSATGTGFLTYVWHYMLARLLYDELVRPLVRGHTGLALAVLALAGAVLLLGRVTRRRKQSRRSWR
jgi:hypothetical protein